MHQRIRHLDTRCKSYEGTKFGSKSASKIRIDFGDT